METTFTLKCMFCYEYFIGQNHGRLSHSIVFLLLLEIKTDQRLSLCSLQWDYNRELARLGGLEPLPDATEKLYMAVRRKIFGRTFGWHLLFRFMRGDRQTW